MFPCGICKGEGILHNKLGRFKSIAPCLTCKGTGKSAIAYDSDDQVIIPGRMAKIMRRVWPNCPWYEEKMPGYKGVIQAVFEDKGGLVVQIQADPLMSTAAKKSKNHGCYCARPEYIKQITGTAESNRLKAWKEKEAYLKAQKEKENEED